MLGTMSKKKGSMKESLDGELMPAKTFVGKAHNSMARSLVAPISRVVEKSHVSSDALAGTLAGAAVGGTIGGPAVAILGAVAGNRLADEFASGNDAVTIIDEMGAFYGMLDIRVRKNAQVRAAQALFMFWLAVFLGTFGMGLFNAILDRTGSHSIGSQGGIYRLVDWVKLLHERSGGRAAGTDILLGEMDVDLVACSSMSDKSGCIAKMIDDPSLSGSLGMVTPKNKINCAWIDVASGEVSSMACRPPRPWYNFYGNAMMGNVSSMSKTLFGVTIRAGSNDAKKRSMVFNIANLFEDAYEAAFYFVVLSAAVYLAAYTTGRYYGGLVRGRCGNNEECQDRMMRLSAHLQDPGQNNSANLWNPLAAGTMGWVIAQSMLGLSFL
jgi:hypothetical protein